MVPTSRVELEPSVLQTDVQTATLQRHGGRPETRTLKALSHPLVFKTSSSSSRISSNGIRDGTRTHNPTKEAEFKSAAYTDSATLTWGHLSDLNWRPIVYKTIALANWAKVAFGPRWKIRTFTAMLLRHMPLPIGLIEELVTSMRIELILPGWKPGVLTVRRRGHGSSS